MEPSYRVEVRNPAPEEVAAHTLELVVDGLMRQVDPQTTHNTHSPYDIAERTGVVYPAADGKPVVAEVEGSRNRYEVRNMMGCPPGTDYRPSWYSHYRIYGASTEGRHIGWGRGESPALALGDSHAGGLRVLTVDEMVAPAEALGKGHAFNPDTHLVVGKRIVPKNSVLGLGKRAAGMFTSGRRS